MSWQLTYVVGDPVAIRENGRGCWTAGVVVKRTASGYPIVRTRDGATVVVKETNIRKRQGGG